MSDDVSRNAMWLAFSLSGFVLLIASANLANLQLVRTAGNVREHTIRAALGAGRFRLLRQSLTESAVVACAGGALGFAVARVVVELVNRRLFVDLPLARMTLDLRVFAFTAICSVSTISRPANPVDELNDERDALDNADRDGSWSGPHLKSGAGCKRH